MTTAELRVLMGVSDRSVNNYLNQLGNEPRLVRIAAYRGRAPLYGLGSAPDAPFANKRLMALPAKDEDELDLCDRRDAQMRADLVRQAVEQATSRQQSWASALGL